MLQQQSISIAIVQNKQQQFLISCRQIGQHLAGKWEFPGGKVESNETKEQAMLRELKEEVGLVATEYCLLETLDFQYPQLDLRLHFYLVSAFEGLAIAQEGQSIKWINVEAFTDYEFPRANAGVINRLCARG